AHEYARLSKKERGLIRAYIGKMTGAEPGADHTVNPNVSGHREGAGGDLSAAPVRSQLHRCRHRASGRRGSRARTSERIGNAADSGARVPRLRQTEIRAVGRNLGVPPVQPAAECKVSQT